MKLTNASSQSFADANGNFSCSTKAKKDFNVSSYRTRDFLSTVFRSRKLGQSGSITASTYFRSLYRPRRSRCSACCECA